MCSLSKTELKNKILELLKEDLEFRYAVAGLIGLEEVLTRLNKNEEAIKSLQEQVYELQKQVCELQKQIKDLQGQVYELQRQVRNLQEQVRDLQGQVKDLQEQVKGLQEQVLNLQIQVNDLTKSIGEVKVAVGSLGHRLGRQFETLIFKIYKDALEDRGIDPGKVEKFIYIDYDGKYTGKPGFKLELDVYIHDDKLYLLEVKSLVEEDDVLWFMQKCEYVEKILNKKASRRIILGINVVKDAYEIAQRYGIDVIYGSLIE